MGSSLQKPLSTTEKVFFAKSLLYQWTDIEIQDSECTHLSMLFPKCEVFLWSLGHAQSQTCEIQHVERQLTRMKWWLCGCLSTWAAPLSTSTAEKVLTRSSLSALGNIRQERKLAETTRLGSGVTEVWNRKLTWKVFWRKHQVNKTPKLTLPLQGIDQT